MQTGDLFLVYRGNLLMACDFQDTYTFIRRDIIRDSLDDELDSVGTFRTPETDPETFARRYLQDAETSHVSFIPADAGIDGSGCETFRR